MNGRKRAAIIGCACGIVLGTISASGADLLLKRIPPLTVEQAPKYPQNLARPELGAKVELGGKTESGDLKLPSGVSTVVVSLPKIEQIDSVGFSNDGASGKVIVATSNAFLPADSPQWHTLPTQSLSAEATRATVGPAEAKYVRLVFVLDRPGRISDLGVYGNAAVADFTAPRARDTASADANLADLHGKARAIYASSGDDLAAAQNLIDDQATTEFAFSANDEAPAVIIDLGRSVPVRRLSILSPNKGAEADIYVFDSLPNQSAAVTTPETLRIDDKTFAHWQPVAGVREDGAGHLVAEFPEKAGRYLMVRWKATSEALRVAEIAAFGRVVGETLVAANAVGRDKDGKTMRQVREVKDFSKDAKDIPAEEPPPPGEGPAPELPQPPPFVFIPEIQPTSP